MVAKRHTYRLLRRGVLLAAGTGVVLALTVPAALAIAPVSAAQATSPQSGAAAAGALARGTVTAISGNVLTIKNDKGAETKVTVPESAKVVQLPPGSKSLASALPMKLQDIVVGDRVLAKTTAGGDGVGFTATTVIAMKQADIAQKQQRDRQDWQTRGVSGLVKSVDGTAQTITLSTGNGAAAKTLTVQASKETIIRRYAADSTKFDDAKPATLDQIKPGDQLRAKGDKSADGTQIAAEDIVAGTFRNIAGTVVSVDSTANTVTINDLATKKPFVVTVNGDSQLHKLDPAVAQGMAMRLKSGQAGGAGSGAWAGRQAGGASGGGAPGGGTPGGRAPGGPGRPGTVAGGPPTAGGASGSGPESGAASGAAGQRGGDLQQALNRAPTLQLAELKKGDAVMVLTTEGRAPGAGTAVTLLAGVEPLLQASPNASQSVLSASWNLGGGGAAAGQDAQ